MAHVGAQSGVGWIPRAGGSPGLGGENREVRELVASDKRQNNGRSGRPGFRSEPGAAVRVSTENSAPVQLSRSDRPWAYFSSICLRQKFIPYISSNIASRNTLNLESAGSF